MKHTSALAGLVEAEKAAVQPRTHPGQWGAAPRIRGRLDSARVPGAGQELAALKRVVQQQHAQLEQLSRSLADLRDEETTKQGE